MSNTIISVLCKLARLVGLPLLKTAFGAKVPAVVWDAVEAFLTSIEQSQDKIGPLVRAANHMKTCEGVGCHMDLVRDR